MFLPMLLALQWSALTGYLPPIAEMCKQPWLGKDGGGKKLTNRRTLAINNPFEFRKRQPHHNLRRSRRRPATVGAANILRRANRDAMRSLSKLTLTRGKKRIYKKNYLPSLALIELHLLKLNGRRL